MLKSMLFEVLCVTWHYDILLPLYCRISWSVSQSQSYFTADSQSVSMSWFRAHFVDVWPDIASCSRVWVWNVLCCLCGAPSLTRGQSVRVRVTLRLIVSQYVLVSSPLCGRLTRYCFLFKSMGLKCVVLSLWGALSDQRSVSQGQSHFTADSQSVCLGFEPTLWTFHQILLPFQELESGICCPVSVERPLWREAGSFLCNSQSSHLSVCTFTIYIFVFHTFTHLLV
jgi:hypothetical protein